MKLPIITVQDHHKLRKKTENNLSSKIIEFNESENNIELLFEIIGLCDQWHSNLPLDETRSKDPEERAEFYREHPNFAIMARMQEESKLLLIKLFMTNDQFNMPDLKTAIEAWRNNPMNLDMLANILAMTESTLSKIDEIDKNTVKILIELQKQVVQDLTLLKSTQNLTISKQGNKKALHRWALIKSLINPENPGKMLLEGYWKEFRHKGDISIATWINSSDDLRSYSEVQRTIHTSKLRGGVGEKDIEYFSEEQRNCSLVKFDKEGKMMKNDQNDVPLDTSKINMFAHENQPGITLYVASKNGIYVYTDTEKFNIRHSSMLAGAPVLCAGTIKVDKGKILMLSTDSGHYQPTKKEIINLLKMLSEKHKVDLTQITVQAFLEGKPVTYNAQELYDSKNNKDNGHNRFKS